MQSGVLYTVNKDIFGKSHFDGLSFILQISQVFEPFLDLSLPVTEEKVCIKLYSIGIFQRMRGISN